MKKVLLYVFALCLVGSGGIFAQETHELSPGTDVISALLDGGTVYEGDILELAAGTYIESDTVLTPFALTIRAAEGAAVKWYVADSIDAIYAGGDLTVENIIFETDTTTPWTFEVDTLTATHNSNVAIQPRLDTVNIKVDYCQFIGFGYGIGADGDFPGSEVLIDSLVVTNSLFYGGARFKTYRGIMVDYNYIHVLIVQNCTFWRVEGECIKVYGSESDDEYFHALVEHNTFVDIGFPGPEQYGIHFKNDPTKNGVGMYLKFTSEDDTLRNNIFFDVADFSVKMASGLFAATYMDYNTSDSSGWGCTKCTDWHDNHGDLGTYNIASSGVLLLTDPDNGDFTLGTGSVAIDAAHDGTDQGSSIIIWAPGSPVSVDDVSLTLPDAFTLRQNYPNPFNPSTRITYSILEGAPVKLDIYDILGRKIRTLVNEVQNPNTYTLVWDGLDEHGSLVSGGIYFYRLQAGTSVETRKMVLLK